MSREAITGAAIVVIVLTVAGAGTIQATRAGVTAPARPAMGVTPVPVTSGPSTEAGPITGQRGTAAPATTRPTVGRSGPSTTQLTPTTPFQATDAERVSPTPAQMPPTPTSTATDARTTTATTTTNRDYDGDGIPDGRDQCPTRPEAVNGFRDGDGCPDVVTTTGAS